MPASSAGFTDRQGRVATRYAIQKRWNARLSTTGFRKWLQMLQKYCSEKLVLTVKWYGNHLCQGNFLPLSTAAVHVTGHRILTLLNVIHLTLFVQDCVHVAGVCVCVCVFVCVCILCILTLHTHPCTHALTQTVTPTLQLLLLLRLRLLLVRQTTIEHGNIHITYVRYTYNTYTIRYYMHICNARRRA